MARTSHPDRQIDELLARVRRIEIRARRLVASTVLGEDRSGVRGRGIEEFIPPANDRRHALRIIRELLFAEPGGTGTDIAGALSYVGRVNRRRAIVFLLSDFFDSGYDAQLRAVAARHEVVALSLNDPRDAELPNVGLLEVRDAETGARGLLDTSNAGVRASYARRGPQLRD